MALRLSRSRWGAVLIGVLAVTLAANPTFAGASNTTGDKVSAAVRAAADKNDKITFWVEFEAEASLTTARAMTNKAAKGAEVRHSKLETATASQANVRKLLDSEGADYKTFWISNAIQVTGSSKMLDAIAAYPEVSKIDEDKTYKIPEPTINPNPLETVNGVEWGLDRIRAPQVWTEFGVRGEGIVVASIDSGVQFDHPALAAKYRGRDASGALNHNYNWFDPAHICPSPAPCDNLDHGTHTMGTMVGDDGGSNQIGVAPGAKWITAKGCETNSCSRASLLASGQWIVAPTDLNGQNPRPDLAPDIVNNSWGGGSIYDPWYEQVVQAWVAAGIFPAFANGNAGPSCNSSGVPGQYNESYSAGAFDVNNVIASFSGRGTGENGEIKPNLAAPGVAVRSSIPGNGYSSFNGTSMASPHLSGTVALIWSASPATRGDINATRALLDTTAIDVNNTTCGGTAAKNNVFGEGRLDAYAAVSSAPRGAIGAVSGTVTSGGAPLAGAKVVATGPISRTTTSAADGTYSFPTLSVGDYVVTASKFGYANATGNATVTEGGTAIVDLSLTQAPSATLSGTVTAGGAPVPGTNVTLADTPLSAVTDAAGAYSIVAPQGQYSMTVASPLRCFTAATQTVTLTGDTTVDVQLPVRADSFGYACAGATGSYPTVTNLVALNGDDSQTTVALPFPVPFYGTNYTSVSVTTNGVAAFGASSTAYSNTTLPSTSEPNGALYPMWDDLWVDASAGVYTGVVGSVPHRRFVIEWRNVFHRSEQTKRFSFLAEIGEDGSVTYRYKGVSGTGLQAGNSATIGVENAAGTVAFQYSYNEAVLTDGLAIAFRTTKHGVVYGKVTDANDGLPLADATADLGAAGSVVSGADGSFIKQIPAGDVTAAVSKTNYETKTVSTTLQAGTVETVEAALRTAKITTSPAALEIVAPANQARTRVVTVTNAGGLGTPVSASEVDTDVSWLGASLGATSLAPGASTTLTVTVDTTGLVPGTVYQASIKLTSQSGRQPELLFPVKLVVPDFQQAIDAGATGSHVDALGDTWTKDFKFVAGEGCGYLGTSNIVTTSNAIAGTDDPSRYADARQHMYEYRCDGLANGTYTVELNFAEIAGLKPNKRVFDVMIEGVEVIPNLDIALEAGGSDTALNRTFVVTVTDGVLNIRFVQHASFNKTLVNALRVTHRPDLAS